MPDRSGPCFTQDALTEPKKPPRIRTAVVIGRWGDDTALLRIDDGTTVEAAVPERLRDAIDVGTRVDLDGDNVVTRRRFGRRR
jgi:hypothetical protein